MHAGYPSFPGEIQHVLSFGAKKKLFNRLLLRIGGRSVATGMAIALKVGFIFVMRNYPWPSSQNRKALEFFEENFIIHDPASPGGKRYYQGRFLFRTDKEGDDMNVLLRFCPHPEKILKKRILGGPLNALAVVETEVLDERAAARAAQDPSEVDLVVGFRDIQTILGMLARPNADVAELLLENLVRVQGNTGHFFKFGAIAKNVTITLGLSR